MKIAITLWCESRGDKLVAVPDPEIPSSQSGEPQKVQQQGAITIIGTAAFFHTMAPTLTTNILTVTLVYCLAKIAQKEGRAVGDASGTHMWLIAVVFIFTLYGFYTWDFCAG